MRFSAGVCDTVVGSCWYLSAHLLLPLMTVSHKAAHYCHFRVLCSTNSDTGRKKKKQKREKKKKKKVCLFVCGDLFFSGIQFCFWECITPVVDKVVRLNVGHWLDVLVKFSTSLGEGILLPGIPPLYLKSSFWQINIHVELGPRPLEHLLQHFPAYSSLKCQRQNHRGNLLEPDQACRWLLMSFLY